MDLVGSLTTSYQHQHSNTSTRHQHCSTSTRQLISDHTTQRISIETCCFISNFYASQPFPCLLWLRRFIQVLLINATLWRRLYVLGFSLGKISVLVVSRLLSLSVFALEQRCLSKFTANTIYIWNPVHSQFVGTPISGLTHNPQVSVPQLGSLEYWNHDVCFMNWAQFCCCLFRSKTWANDSIRRLLTPTHKLLLRGMRNFDNLLIHQ